MIAFYGMVRAATLMFTQFYANNYKSLVDFSLPLAPELTILAGANGAGKTSVCEAMELGLMLATERPQELFGHREPALLRNKWLKTRRMSFEWTMQLESELPAIWHVDVNKRKHWGIAQEWATRGDELILDRKTNTINVYNEDAEDWDTEKKALPSYLSTLYEESVSSYPTLCQIQRQLVGRYIPFLNPAYLRARSRQDDLGAQGENFARHLFALSKRYPVEFDYALNLVKNIFPHVKDVKTVRGKYGWTEIQIEQRVGPAKSADVFKAGQVNDGLLRLLALATACFAPEGLRLLVVEEPENGMHPRLLESTLDLLRALPVQVVITTHSPVLLNFARPEEVVVMRWKMGAGGPEAASFRQLEAGMKRMGYLDIGDVLYNIDDDKLFAGWSSE